MSCGKTQGFLADAGLEAKEQVDAKKNTYGEKQAMELLKTVSEVYAAKGKKVVHFNLKKEKPSAADLKKVISLSEVRPAR